MVRDNKNWGIAPSLPGEAGVGPLLGGHKLHLLGTRHLAVHHVQRIPEAGIEAGSRASTVPLNPQQFIA